MFFDHTNKPCLLCDATTNTSFAMCDLCLQSLPRIRNPCSCCGLAHSGPLFSLCGSCLQQPPPIRRCISALSYEFPVKQLLSRYKYQQQWLYGNLFAQLMFHAICECYCDSTTPEILLAVPLHPAKLRQRGFNQSFELARRVARLSGIPLLRGVLKRSKNTPQQQGLPLKQRRRNIRNAFTLNTIFANQHILLIDDVVTSGSTTYEISRLLLQHGAGSVDVCCLARTPETNAFR